LRVAAQLSLEDADSERRKGRLRSAWDEEAESAFTALCSRLNAEVATQRDIEARCTAVLQSHRASCGPELSVLLGALE
jgi:hypothetical protein